MREIISLFEWAPLEFIQTYMRSPIADRLMPVISSLGDNGMIWLVTGVILICVKKYRPAGVSVLLALMLAGLTGNVILKPLIARVRPCDVADVVLLIPRPSDFSFPSGHSMSSAAAAAAIFVHNRRIGGGALVLAAAIAFSRLYLYVHYPSDVLCGLAIGAALGILASAAVRRALKRRACEHHEPDSN